MPKKKSKQINSKVLQQRQKKFVTGLKRLFSSDTIVRHIDSKKLKVIDTDGSQYQEIIKNTFPDKYKRIRQMQDYNIHNTSTGFTMPRMQLFQDYEAMDKDPVLSSALDIYSDESTTLDEYGDLLVINSDNEEIKDVLNNLFYDILNIDFNLWSWVRNMCKYGDMYLKLDIHHAFGIIGVTPLSVYDVERIEGENLENPREYYFTIGGNITERIESFEMAHFRMYTDANFLPYGKSMLEGARKPWKQLSLMEDAMMINRVMRAPDKRVFKIDIGNIPPEQVDTYMSDVIEEMKKTPYINPQTGEYNLKFNMQNMLEDIFLPVRGGDTGTEIENLSGLQFDTIDDINYIKDRMMAALKIPKPFLGYSEEINAKCISLDTEIPLLNGKTKKVFELIKDFNNGIKNYVYSINENKDIVPGEIEWTGKTRLNTQVVEVVLDNSKSIICTPDHKFMLRDGSFIEAQNLTKEQSLMPYYTELSTDKYIKNHKVKEVIWLDQKIDTADLTIKEYHNFATTAGVFIHNSTLAAMDLRFARTIERVQKMIISELYKIATIHLYAQGFRNDELVNYELKLTSPSIVYEEEKLEIWDRKASVVSSLKDLGMVSDDYIYEKILNISENEYKEMRKQLINDKKRQYRYETIERDGNDPAKNNNAEQNNNSNSNPWESIEKKDNNKKKKKKSNSIANQLFNGDKENHDATKMDKTSHKHDYKGNSPLALEQLDKYLQKQKEDEVLL